MHNNLEARLAAAIDLHNLNRASLTSAGSEGAFYVASIEHRLDQRFDRLAKETFKHVWEKYGPMIEREHPTRYVNTTLFDSKRAAILLYGGRISLAEFAGAPHDLAFHTNPYMAIILTTAGPSKLLIESSLGWGHPAEQEDITDQELTVEALADRFVSLYEKIAAA